MVRETYSDNDIFAVFFFTLSSFVVPAAWASTPDIDRHCIIVYRDFAYTHVSKKLYCVKTGLRLGC